MAGSYRVIVTEVHPDGDINKRSCREVFSKTCMRVAEANELMKAKEEEYRSTPKGKIQFMIDREAC